MLVARRRGGDDHHFLSLPSLPHPFIHLLSSSSSRLFSSLLSFHIPSYTPSLSLCDASPPGRLVLLSPAKGPWPGTSPAIAGERKLPCAEPRRQTTARKHHNFGFLFPIPSQRTSIARHLGERRLRPLPSCVEPTGHGRAAHDGRRRREAGHRPKPALQPW